MKTFRMPKAWTEDPVKAARVAELLRVCEAFGRASRQVPGHVLRELVRLRVHWGKNAVPASVIDAAAKLARSGR